MNKAGVARARTLIDDGDWDDRTEWSDDAPSTDEQNEYIDEKIGRAAAAAASYRLTSVEDRVSWLRAAADDLLQRLDARRS